MTFKQRLRYFSFGLLLGIMIVYGMFGDRSCSSPNEIKMYELASQDFELSELAKCKLHCMRKNIDLIKIELRHFEIDYELSAPRKKPCGEYFVQPKQAHVGHYPYKILMLDCDTITRIEDIQVNAGVRCPCQ